MKHACSTFDLNQCQDPRVTKEVTFSGQSSEFSSHYVSVLSEIGVTGGIISSVKILLSWYINGLIRLITNAESAMWPFMNPEREQAGDCY